MRKRLSWPSLTVVELVAYVAYLLFIGYALSATSEYVGLTVTVAMLVGLGPGFRLGRK